MNSLRRPASKATVFEQVARSVRESVKRRAAEAGHGWGWRHGRVAITAHGVQQVWQAMQRGEAVPHGAIGLCAQSQLAAVRDALVTLPDCR